MTRKIKNLTDKNLVDILGASLKGSYGETAAKVTGNSIKLISWDNILESIDYDIKVEV